MKYKNYYAALGVPHDADLDQIKKAYRKLARQHHPDVSKAADAEARFKDAAEAYATLKNPEKRAAYDALGQQPEGAEFAPPPQWQREHGQHSTEGFSGPGFDDLDLADLLAAFGRGSRHATGDAWTAAAPGRDLDSSISISLEDAYRGAALNLQLGEGSGQRTLEVTIPPGVIQGQKLRLRGLGGKGQRGAADGDLYLHISLAPHPVFRALERDLYFDLALTPWEAALGAELEVPTLGGPVLLTVPPGTRAGRKLRLRGRGLPAAKTSAATADSAAKTRAGDLYAQVHIDVPAELTPREHELFTALATVSTFNPRAAHPKEPAHDATAH